MAWPARPSRRSSSWRRWRLNPEQPEGGISTREALGHIARALKVSLRFVGSAGLKDARAVTRQWISVEHADPERLALGVAHAAVIAIYATASVWSVRQLFYG